MSDANKVNETIERMRQQAARKRQADADKEEQATLEGENHRFQQAVEALPKRIEDDVAAALKNDSSKRSVKVTALTVAAVDYDLPDQGSTPKLKGGALRFFNWLRENKFEPSAKYWLQRTAPMVEDDMCEIYITVTL